jgi:dihydrofolate reductase
LLIESPQSTAAHSVAEGLAAAAKAAEPKRGVSKECFVIGGASIYDQFAPFVDRYLITLVEKAVPDADTFFNLGLFSAEDWEISAHSKVEGDGVLDECDFSVFELSATRSDKIKCARDEAIEAYKARAPGQARRMAPRQKTSTEQLVVHAML